MTMDHDMERLAEERRPGLDEAELDADIYDGTSIVVQIPPPPSGAPHDTASTLALDAHATATILLLRSTLEERDAAIVGLQADLRQARAEVDHWRNAVRGARLVARNVPVEPEAVGPAVDRLRAREARLRDLVMAGRRRETALLVRLSSTQEDLLSAHNEMEELSTILTPVNLQTQRLLLDPAVCAQYSRLKSVAEGLEKRVRELQDDLAAVQFTPHSKSGKMLMAKCRTLQEENEEIGREASEGRVHDLENKLALQKQLNSELKRGYQELQEYVADMNEESEKLQETVYRLQRQLQMREQEVQELSSQKTAAAAVVATAGAAAAAGAAGVEGRVGFPERMWEGSGQQRERDSRRRGGKRSRGHDRPRGPRGAEDRDSYDYR